MSFLEGAAWLALGLLSVAMALCLVRLAKGPSVPDRVAALDLVAMLGVGWMATYAVVRKSAVYLDPAVMMGLVAFVGTVAFARYLEAKL